MPKYTRKARHTKRKSRGKTYRGGGGGCEGGAEHKWKRTHASMSDVKYRCSVCHTACMRSAKSECPK